MLQQTRVEAVLPYYHNWMERFPDLKQLALAQEGQVLKAWEGLGYYSRARNLHKAAQGLHLQGQDIPQDYEELLQLPGVGPYTAAAISSIAFDLAQPLLDGNVKRVFARLLDWPEMINIKSTENHFFKLGAALLYNQSPRIINQALMELGALICTPKSPQCNICPVANFCQARAQQTQDLRPLTPPRAKTIKEKKWFWVLEHQGRYLVQNQCKNKLWAGMPLFPFQEMEGEPSQALTDLGISEKLQELCSFKYSVTVYRVQAVAFLVSLENKPAEVDLGQWVSLEELEDLSLPRPGVLIRKALKARHKSA